MSKPLVPGRIIWAAAPSGRGSGKRRPLVITTTRQDILSGAPIAAVACSTSFAEPPRPVEVRLPFDPTGRAMTRLTEPTVAVCDWLEQFSSHDSFSLGGLVPPAIFRVIIEKAGLTPDDGA